MNFGEKGLVIALFFGVAFISFASAGYVYGDIYIDSYGQAEFFVESDVPERFSDFSDLVIRGSQIAGETSQLVDKIDGVWIMGVDFGYFDDMQVRVHLSSRTSEVYSIEGDNIVLELEDSSFYFYGSGDFETTLRYSVEDDPDYLSVFWTVVLILLVSIIVFIALRRRSKRSYSEVFPFLNPSAAKILEYLEENGKTRYLDLRKKLDIPKASFSRYISNLSKKNLVNVVGSKKSKVVMLK